MNEYAAVVAERTVQFERLLPGPIARVWSCLTESDERGTWFASGDFDLKVGGKTELLFRHSDITPETPPEAYREMNEKGVRSQGRITQLVSGKRLAFSWGGDDAAESEVIFDLTPQGDKVRLTLTHRNLPGKAEMAIVSTGWHLHLGLLEDKLTGNPPRGFWSRHAALEAEYARRMGL